MARISAQRLGVAPDRRQQQRQGILRAASPRRLAIPDVAWLALGVGGLAVAVGNAAWGPAGVGAAIVGFYVLGVRHGEAAPDPVARQRVVSLERAVLGIALLERDGAGERAAAVAADAGAAEPRSTRRPRPLARRGGGTPGLRSVPGGAAGDTAAGAGGEAY